MSSSLAISNTVMDSFLQLKINQKNRYAIYKINESYSELIVDRTSESTSWDDFLHDLPDDEPRFAVYEFKYEKPTGEGPANKFILVDWSPDNAPMKAKMMHSASKAKVRQALDGISLYLTASDKSDIVYEDVLDRARQ